MTHMCNELDRMTLINDLTIQSRDDSRSELTE